MLPSYHQYFLTVHGSEIQKNMFCINRCGLAILINYKQRKQEIAIYKKIISIIAAESSFIACDGKTKYIKCVITSSWQILIKGIVSKESSKRKAVSGVRRVQRLR